PGLRLESRLEIIVALFIKPSRTSRNVNRRIVVNTLILQTIEIDARGLVPTGQIVTNRGDARIRKGYAACETANVSEIKCSCNTCTTQCHGIRKARVDAGRSACKFTTHEINITADTRADESDFTKGRETFGQEYVIRELSTVTRNRVLANVVLI